MYSTIVHPVFALALIVFSCIGGAVVTLRLWRWLTAKFGGAQYVTVRVEAPTDRAVKRDVDDMMLHDMIVGDPETHVGDLDGSV